MDERNSKYELQASRNGLTVPVINGVYLHSIYIFNIMQSVSGCTPMFVDMAKFSFVTKSTDFYTNPFIITPKRRSHWAETSYAIKKCLTLNSHFAIIEGINRK